MDPDGLPGLILTGFVILVIVLALGSEITGWNLAALINPLSEVFVPIFVAAVLIALAWVAVQAATS